MLQALLVVRMPLFEGLDEGSVPIGARGNMKSDNFDADLRSSFSQM